MKQSHHVSALWKKRDATTESASGIRGRNPFELGEEDEATGHPKFFHGAMNEPDGITEEVGVTSFQEYIPDMRESEVAEEFLENADDGLIP